MCKCTNNVRNVNSHSFSLYLFYYSTKTSAKGLNSPFKFHNFMFYNYFMTSAVFHDAIGLFEVVFVKDVHS